MPPSISALQICSSLSNQLAKTPLLSLTVHSIFDKVCNLEDQNGDIITLITAPNTMLPYAILLPQKIWQTWEIGEKLNISVHKLAAQKIDIDLSNAKLFAPFMPDYYFEKNQHNSEIFYKKKTLILANLLNLLENNIKPQGIFLSLLPLFKLTQNSCLTAEFNAELDTKISIITSKTPAYKIMEFTNFLKVMEQTEDHHNQSLIVEAVKAIIGFGAGLTPSADDFILGYLCIQQFQNNQNVMNLQAAILANLSRTTFTSVAMLKNACHNMYSQHILEIIAKLNQAINLQTICDNQLENAFHLLILACKNALNYGHSSGHDMLCGLYFGIATMTSR